MKEYICYFLNEGRENQRIYHAEGLPDAMALHNTVMPEFSKSVLKWVDSADITFLMHDSAMTIKEES